MKFDPKWKAAAKGKTIKPGASLTALHEHRAEQSLDAAVDAARAYLDTTDVRVGARRIKIATADGAREITHKELVILLARRTAIAEDVRDGRKPRYVKCHLPACVLLLPAPRMGVPIKYCTQHKAQVKRERVRAYREANIESVRDRERKRFANEVNRKKKRAADRARAEKNREKKREYDRAYGARNRERRRANGRAHYEANREIVILRVRACRERNRAERERGRSHSEKR